MAATHVYSFAPAAEGTNVTTHSFTVPTGQGIAAADTLVVCVDTANNYTLTNATLGTAASLIAASGRAQSVWVYQLTAGDIGSAFTITSSGSCKVSIKCTVLRGLTGALAATPAPTSTASSATTQTCPAGSPAAGRVIVQAVSVFTASVAPPATYTPPTGVTLRSSQGTGGTTGRGGGAVGTDLTENHTPGTAWTSDVAGAWAATTLTLNVALQGGASGGTVAWAGSAAGQSVEPEDVLYTGATFSTSTTKTLAGTLVPWTDSRIRLRGGDGWAAGTGTNQANFGAPASRYPRTWGYGRSYGFSFRFTGQRFEFYLLYQGGYGQVRVSVNGQRCTDVLQQITGSNAVAYYYKVDLGASLTNATILIEGNGVPIGGVVPETDGQVGQIPAYTRPPLIAQGDSITDGSATGNVGGPAGTWFARLARFRGWENPWNEAIGGTGFVEPGTAVNIMDRMTDVTAPAAGMGLLFAGGNDSAASTVYTQAASYVDQWRAAHPGVPLVIMGTFGPTSPAATFRQSRDSELEQVAIDKGCPFVSNITGRIRNSAGTLVATMTPFINSAADQAAYINTTDNIHPLDAGHKALARWMDRAFDQITPEPGFGSGSGSTAWSGAAAGKRFVKGAAAGSDVWLGAAAGKMAPKGVAAGSVAWSGSAAGVKPTVTARAGSASGQTAWAGSAVGKRVPVGAAAGSVVWAGIASGVAVRRGSAAGSDVWLGSATGVKPVVGAKTGVANGVTTWAGTAAGKMQPRGSASGSRVWLGSAVGRMQPEGSAGGSVVWAGSGVGLKPSVAQRSGSAAGAVVWLGAATGVRPTVTARAGVAAGSIVWTGSGLARTVRRAVAAGSVLWVGTATKASSDHVYQLSGGLGSRRLTGGLG